MKKITLISLLIIAAASSNAQVKSKPVARVKAKEQVKPVEVQDEDFNRWTLEVNAGQSKGVKPYETGFYSSQTKSVLGKVQFNSYSIGARYMISPKFGFKANIGYDDLKNLKGNGSKDFEMVQKSLTLQGVVNASRLFNIDDVIGRWGFLIHGGVQINMMTSKTENSIGDSHNFGRTEHNLGLVFGFSPQFRVSNRISILFDIYTANYFRQHYNWDGSFSDNINNLNGQLINTSLGLTYSFGSQKMHGDWAEIKDKNIKEIDALNKRVEDMETMMNDSDKDGVPDYLDQENNSVAGVAVDTKGKMVDINKNGVPDELERYLSNTYTTKESTKETNADMIKKMVNEGYISTYFDPNKATPTNVSTEGIDFILTYLRNNPTASIDIIGHADEIGASEFNQKLALGRAESVKNILIKAKIDPSRLNIVSAGEDASVDKNSDGARKLVRRVTFKVK
ncbi:OmpA family protein [Flavobacterium sp. SUN046]|uniref:OmpA family protein n=1 Tax=Flavobacterium sp. SUN046 TaxID=3002440 RepID=UPI002DB6C39D|nr:OmpA family protein [Flavobacterium sp. SUN046]MEC4048365.1 OmpA family protein [Flavobacterium sp. SUN046]